MSPVKECVDMSHYISGLIVLRLAQSMTPQIKMYGSASVSVPYTMLLTGDLCRRMASTK